MTQQHEKTFFYEEAVRLAEKHGGTVEIPKHGLPDIVIYASGLAALIADVRRQERALIGAQLDDALTKQAEEDAGIADKTVCACHIPTGIKIYGTKAGDAIRARLVPLEGKEEGND